MSRNTLSGLLTQIRARYRHIVIEGPIGVGKTSLARKLAENLDAELHLEQPEANPFLERFYQDANRFALPTQLFFLFQRVNQLRDLAQRDLFANHVVGDFLLDKDPLFAQLTLADDELKLYQQIYDSQRPQAPSPDLVVFLHASPDALVERVQRRGNPIESKIDEGYLRALSEAYNKFFYYYSDAPLLTVNTEHLNPIEHDDDWALLISHIAELKGRRGFFNRA